MRDQSKIHDRVGWAMVHACLVGDTDGLNLLVDQLGVDEARNLVAGFAAVVGSVMTRGTTPERCAEVVRELLHEMATESDQ